MDAPSRRGVAKHTTRKGEQNPADVQGSGLIDGKTESIQKRRSGQVHAGSRLAFRTAEKFGKFNLLAVSDSGKVELFSERRTRCCWGGFATHVLCREPGMHDSATSHVLCRLGGLAPPSERRGEGFSTAALAIGSG